LLKGLGNVLVKELKELLRDPKILIGMIVVPLVMFPILGFVIRGAMESTEQRIQNLQIGIVDFDHGELGQNLSSFLSSIPGVRLINITASSVDDAVEFLSTQTNASDLVVIPSGATANVTGGVPAIFDVYSVFSGAGGMSEITGSSVVAEYLTLFTRLQSPDPFITRTKSIIKGEPTNVAPSVLFGIMYSQVFALPITISILLVFSMQIAATSVASEKEEKTLETLLSLPIGRFTILAGKLAGSMGAFTVLSGPGGAVDLAAIGLAPTPLGYVVLGASVFMSLLAALALAIIISAFSEDVRGAQSIVGYLYVLIMLPMFIVIFAGYNTLPLILKLVLFAIPYTHPMLAAQATITGDYLTAVIGVAYVAIFTVTLLYAAAKLFATEKILTAKLRFRGFRLLRRRREPVPT
jgi:ABC-2 type transport system permease protein